MKPVNYQVGDQVRGLVYSQLSDQGQVRLVKTAFQVQILVGDLVWDQVGSRVYWQVEEHTDRFI